MCSGGSAPQAAQIVMPDTGAYQQQFNMQKDMIQQQMQGQMTLMQNQLQSSLRRKEDLMRQITEAKTAKAESLDKVDEQVRRMNTLIGAPPPEPTAQAPRIGANRNSDVDRKGSSSVKRGRTGLRIARSTASGYGQGAGLNIT